MKTLWLCLFFLLLQFQSGISEHNYDSTSLCRKDQKQLLLQFSRSLHQSQPDPFNDFEYGCDLLENYYKTKYWNESLDCCGWDGVTCDVSTGFVVGLDLSCGSLTGDIHSNSTLFRLTRLRKLNLAFNHFNGSQISPEFGWLSSLTHLNLSNSMFSGLVPRELYYLSNLISLDISSEYVGDSYKIYCDLRLLSKNITKIEVLLLSWANISSEIPTNMSSFLTRLDLQRTGLHGNLPLNFFERPNLQILILGSNDGLKGSLPNTLNCSNVLSFREFDLSRTNVFGRLPESIGCLKNLVHMDLAQTNISGRLPESIGLLSNLVDLDLSWTTISGRLPESIGLLENLVQMDINKCNLWGPIPESIGNITKIQYIDMSMNKLSGEVPPTISNLRQLYWLDLSSNNLGGLLPDAFANLQNLSLLSLSNNSFLGGIPSSISNASGLDRLDISSNALTGFFPSGGGNRSLQNLRTLEMSRNFLREYPPWLHLQNLQYLSLSYNELEGTFPLFICNNTSLSYLDLSNNKFRGKLPPCIGNSSNTLEILVLSRNEFSGTIPTLNGHNLQILELSDNHMDGRLPQSLANCTQLEVLDLGKNMFHGTFPRWLQTLPYLNALILKSNNFHGSLSPPVSNDSFNELQIIDLSHNNFTGLLPEKLFTSFLTMKTHASFSEFNYYYSVTISVKGDDREFTDVRPIVMTIDLSSNNFYGSIPESLADLTSLWLLNLSHNHLSGSIPPAFSHLAALEQLDLSSNRLTGGIPHTLTNLTFLGFLNLSYNHLVGPIPEGSQFSTFPRESYVGNLGLYGAPLTRNYGNGKEPPSLTVFQEDEDDDDSGFMTGFTWQAVAQGYGCGIVIGFVIGSVMLRIGKPRWFARFYYTEAANCLRRRNKRGRAVRGRR